MLELDYKKAECWRTDAFELWCWRKLLRVPGTVRRSNQSWGFDQTISLGKSVLNIHWKDRCWNSSTLVTWCKELTHWKIPWCRERLKAGGERDDRGWNCWMTSLTPLIWVWPSSGSWWYYLTISSSPAPSIFAFNLSLHQGIFQWVGSLHQVAKVLELQH